MVVETAADLAGFFETDEFAELATFYPKTGPALENIPVVVSRPVDAGTLGELTFTATQRRVLVRAADVGAIVRGGRFELAGETYAVDGAPALDETATVWEIPIKPVGAAA